MQCDRCKDDLGAEKPVKGFTGRYCSPFCRSKAEPAHLKITGLCRESLEILAYDLFALATHKDCPQWVRDSAEAIFNDLTNQKQTTCVKS